jgi:hypothetical protein
VSGTFTIEANRIWGLIPGVEVRLDAVISDEPAGPFALVTIARTGAAPEQVRLRVGDTIELGGQPFALERVWDRGRRSTWANRPAAGPLPGEQPGRVATFAPAARG